MLILQLGSSIFGLVAATGLHLIEVALGISLTVSLSAFEFCPSSVSPWIVCLQASSYIGTCLFSFGGGFAPSL